MDLSWLSPIGEIDRVSLFYTEHFNINEISDAISSYAIISNSITTFSELKIFLCVEKKKSTCSAVTHLKSSFRKY